MTKIEEIALRVANGMNTYCETEYEDSTHCCYEFSETELFTFANALLAELSWEDEPVAVVEEIGRCVDGTPIFNGVGTVSVGQKLYTRPANTAEIEQRVAEACTQYVRSWNGEVAVRIADGLDDGEWREYL